jgi:hypothetical protein
MTEYVRRRAGCPDKGKILTKFLDGGKDYAVVVYTEGKQVGSHYISKLDDLRYVLDPPAPRPLSERREEAIETFKEVLFFLYGGRPEESSVLTSVDHVVWVLFDALVALIRSESLD